ncbi:hypothetical protein TSUD_58090 [Trifolium subterraneum]|uniref:Uncharacterized protein n=1 Tax=Trifolium subterraneum TaxID=3900 RepID=A0A2Z6MIC2_TRISU|nr:hypothetical protein TSUD_58090 [Trifolium subterraneum]
MEKNMARYIVTFYRFDLNNNDQKDENVPLARVYHRPAQHPLPPAKHSAQVSFSVVQEAT